MEILFVIAIIGLLSIFLVPKLTMVVSDSKEQGVLLDYHCVGVLINGYQLRSNRLPNISTINSQCPTEYSFSIRDARILSENGHDYLTVIGESSLNSSLGTPTSLYYVIDATGLKPSGYIYIEEGVDINNNGADDGVSIDNIMNFDESKIISIIVANTKSSSTATIYVNK